MTKYECYKIYRKALKDKIIIRDRACSMCHHKIKTLHGHHTDYDRPLDVIWLCPSCHTHVHLWAINMPEDPAIPLKIEDKTWMHEIVEAHIRALVR